MYHFSSVIPEPKGSMDILVEKQGHVLSATIMIKFVCGMRLTLKGLKQMK